MQLAIERYRKAWPFFKASLSYVFDRKGTSGDSHCKLTKLAAACLGDKPLHVATVVRYVRKLNPAFYEIFLSVLSSVDDNLDRYEPDILVGWIKSNAARVKLYAIIYFYRCVSRPCNVSLLRLLLYVDRKLRWMEGLIAEENLPAERLVWKDLVPKPIRLSTSGLLKEILSQLSKIKNKEIHPLVKICMERYRPQWPLHLALIIPRRRVFIKTVVTLRRLSNAKKLGPTLRLLTDNEKREIKTIILLHQRCQQIEICYDDRLPTKDLTLLNTDYVKDVSSVCICQFCSSVLTFVDLKNRPPVKGVYYDSETLRYRCGNCHSRNVHKFPLVDWDSTFRIIQADLPSVGVCSGRRDCFNLAAMPRGVCGTCATSSRKKPH